MRAGSSQDSWQPLLRRVGEGVFLLLQIGIPGGGIPDLQPGIRADDNAVPLKSRVLAKRRRDRDPALLVRYLVGGAGEEDPAVITYRLRGHRRGPQRLGDPAELLLREYVEAALLTFRQHQPLRKIVTVLRRKEQPALVIK